VEHKEREDWVSAWRHVVDSSKKGRGRGRPSKTLRGCVEEDMARLKL
jgi:hypothetical protein